MHTYMYTAFLKKRIHQRVNPNASKGEGQAYFREVVTKEVWQPLWAWLLNMDGFHFDPGCEHFHR